MGDDWNDDGETGAAETSIIATAELPEINLFGKWNCDEVNVSDMSLQVIFYRTFLVFRNELVVYIVLLCFQDYIAVKEKSAKYLPHSSGRYAAKRFRKAQCPIVERLVNSLMMHGRNNGKKLMTVRIVKHSFEIIHLLSGEASQTSTFLTFKTNQTKACFLSQNPLQVLVNAIINSGPREDSTRIGRAGTARRQAVDVSPLRRVNQVGCFFALHWGYNLCE
jgi:small subunit ribosomal protein S5e